ncbi:MAG: hypothetical protein IPN59_08935 [Holophaga sp.]|nr:hypothetical protein [Holophaga sp.]
MLILFASSFLVSYFFAFMSVHELRLENGQSDPRNPTFLGWIMTLVVTVQSALLLAYSWRIKLRKPWSLVGRAGFGAITYIGIVSLAALSIFIVTKTWIKLTYFAEFSPAMKGGLLSVGVHIIGFLFWLPAHLLLWCIPWKSPIQQPNQSLNPDATSAI